MSGLKLVSNSEFDLEIQVSIVENIIFEDYFKINQNEVDLNICLHSPCKFRASLIGNCLISEYNVEL